MTASFFGTLILIVLLLLSLASVAAILLKWREIRRVESLLRLPGRIEHLSSLSVVERQAGVQPDSPYLNLLDRAQSLRHELMSHQKTQKLPSIGMRPAEMQGLELSLNREVDAVAQALERRLPFLQITAAVSPLLGLLGTVVGVLLTFRGIAEAQTPSLAAVAPGVSEALITTVAGLTVAIPAVVAYGWFAARIEGFVRRMEQFGADLITILAEEMRS